MESIKIENFGPIKYVDINLDKDIQIFVGEQAAGKSTLCKTIYFCKKIKDYLISFITNIETVKNVKQDDYYKKFITELRSKFIGTFGTTKHMDPFTIKYLFGKHKIDIVLSAKNDKGYIRFYFDSLLRTFIADILKEYYGIITEASYNQKSILDIFGTNGLIDRKSVV